MVEVINKSDEPVIRNRRYKDKPFTFTRKRVAAYVRVSTNGEEQLQSFKSQKEYYQEKISANKEWVLVGIYADEGITGTKTNKRDGFLKMIDDCSKGLVDIVITKSVSRFSRNLVDTLSYTRMLKEKGVTVIFEKENIDTSTMESEMQLSLISALAQNEVESLSQNVSMGVQMKMARGELMGFNGCLGYDYHPEDKSITINEKEADTVRLVYELYLQGYGAYRIAKELTALGKENKKGEVKWTDSGVMGIIKNEKYMGALLMGKTYTVDPISKRRLENKGESNKYYTKEHHEPIVSKEVWEKAQEIREGRYRLNNNVFDSSRIRYARKYAFSSICICGFCGKSMTRRAHNQDRKSTKPVWKCRTATNEGIANCPHSKAIDEKIIENAFLDMFKLLSDNFDDVLGSVLQAVENSLANDDNTEKLKRVEKDITSLTRKKKKLTDIYLDDKISSEDYNAINQELNTKLNALLREKEYFSKDISSKEIISERMHSIKKRLKEADVVDKFDRIVFESIVEKIVVGEIAADGTIDPYKLTFVLKGMGTQSVPEARERYRQISRTNKGK